MNTAKNTAVLTKGLARFGEVVEACKSAATDIPTMVPKIREMINKADEIGVKAKEKGFLKPHECFEFHTGEKKTAAEIQAEEDAKTGKKGKKGKKEKPPKKAAPPKKGKNQKGKENHGEGEKHENKKEEKEKAGAEK